MRTLGLRYALALSVLCGVVATGLAATSALGNTVTVVQNNSPMVGVLSGSGTAVPATNWALNGQQVQVDVYIGVGNQWVYRQTIYPTVANGAYTFRLTGQPTGTYRTVATGSCTKGQLSDPVSEAAMGYVR